MAHKNMQTLSERVFSAYGTESVREIARKSDIPVSTLGSIVSGSQPRLDNLIALAAGAKVDISWLATGEGYMRPESINSGHHAVSIPRYPVSASAGSGRFLDDDQPIDHVPFPSDFFSAHVRSDPNDVFLINAAGDSMEPSIGDGDMIMIDRRAAQGPIAGGIYCFTYGDLTFVKRLQQLPDGILARSDNKDYADFMMKIDQLDQFHAIGRVVWIGRSL
ncbi:MAG: helix-turn-helix transcriptional regulator [Marinibacterium sp.]|nr:helix-turn-helix transcriptional regulator [Marinibacterium sp.]